MKQLLSGNDWLVSYFAPGEVSAYTSLPEQIAKGNLYGGSFIPATVPGDVQSDALDAHLIEDINYGYNARSAEWTYQRDWMYVKRFTPCETSCDNLRLCFDGVDYACEVYVNGKWIGNHEGAWPPFSFDITNEVVFGQENSLLVLVKSAPAEECQWGLTSKVRTLKARFAYHWDWCTRLVPLGIWKDVYLQYVKKVVIEDLHVVTDVDYIKKKAIITAMASISGETSDNMAEFVLQDPNGNSRKIAVNDSDTKLSVQFEVDEAMLWYPNGMGEQPLYQVTISIPSEEESRTVRVGLRHIEWKRTEGAGEDALPYQPYINGRRVYLQGYNFTPIRQLYGRVQEEVYRKRVLLCKRSNANYLRVWGGGLLEREEFYDACDEMGILIMQEFFQSSATGNNHPPRDREYIQMLLESVESAVIQKRNHPSLLCWCGGNELCYRGDYMDAKGNILIENAEGMEGYLYDIKGRCYIPLDPEYITLKEIGDLTKKLDPDRMYFHTTGSGPHIQNANEDYIGGRMHDVHGPWELLRPEYFYRVYNAYDMMFHHEFGCPASASIQTIEQTIPKEYRWPLGVDNPMANYHGRMHLTSLRRTRAFFGEATDYKNLATASRFLQWEQMRYALEAHRRRGLKCAGACLWHFGEPWPNVADNCVVDVFDQVKPAYYGQTAAFRPLHIAARYDQIIHRDSFSVDMTLYNATEYCFEGEIRVQIYKIDGTLLEEKRFDCQADADTVVPCVKTLCFENLPQGVFFLCQQLYDKQGNMMDSGYSIHTTRQDLPYAQLWELPECKIQTVLEGKCLKLKNLGEIVVSGLTVESANDNNVLFSDGCILLLPGEEKEIWLEYENQTPGELFLSGFGVPYHKATL